MGRQACRDHIVAAHEGHVVCLQRLCDEGKFMALDAPNRSSAGEFPRAQVWEAAAAACKAGYDNVLTWIFSSGWPSRVDELPWHLLDLDDECEVDLPEHVVGDNYPPAPGRLESRLYHHALHNSSASCLNALLAVGCRSPWICPLAACHQKKYFLFLAAKNGCRCD
jgi:hypothetical protein